MGDQQPSGQGWNMGEDRLPPPPRCESEPTLLSPEAAGDLKLRLGGATSRRRHPFSLKSGGTDARSELCEADPSSAVGPSTPPLPIHPHRAQDSPPTASLQQAPNARQGKIGMSVAASRENRHFCRHTLWATIPPPPISREIACTSLAITSANLRLSRAERRSLHASGKLDEPRTPISYRCRLAP